jgi:phosphoenolpyruvate carboxykinase (ATP)
MYHFISGYTAKIAGTEIGITEPTATFSACFGAAFLVWHPTKYAEMLAERMQAHDAQAWLVNTGWSGGAYGVGSRLNIEYTRAMIDAIHHGDLQRAPTIEDPIFGLQIPTACPGVPSEVLIPWNTWPTRDAHQQAARKLAALFQKNFDNYRAEASDATCAAGPKMG